MKIPKAIIAILLMWCAPWCNSAEVKLEPDARWQLEFPALSETLATAYTGEKQPARLTVRLPANYSKNAKFPLFIFLNGGDGGRGDTLPLDRKTVGSNDFICVNMPLFKRTYDTNNGPSITVDDLGTIGNAYRTMLGKLLETVPNTQVERSALGGFSNGAHAVGLLLAGGDEFVLSHFRAFYLIEGGNALAANALGRPALKNCRFLLMRGDQKETDPERKIYTLLTDALTYAAKERGLNFEIITMRGVGHDLPSKYQVVLGQWVRGEKLTEEESPPNNSIQ